MSDITTPGSGAAQGAEELRSLFGQMVSNMKSNLAQIRDIVQAHGRSALNAELGAHGAQMLSLYNDCKSSLDNIPGGAHVQPDLPNP